jgi:hypothetical protein
VSDNPSALPSFVKSANFPFEGQLRVKRLDPPVDTEPARDGEDPASCVACGTSDDAYIWVSDRWRVRAMDRPGGLPMVLILESRSHLDLGDLPNLLAAELGVMTVRLERAIRSLDGVASVHVNRWADGPAHLHLWFLARPTGHLQLRGTFLSMWDDILERIDEARWEEDLALVAAWLGEFGGRVLAEPPRIEWHAPSRFGESIPDLPVHEPADTPAAHTATAGSPEATPPPTTHGQPPSTAVPPALTGQVTGGQPEEGRSVAPQVAEGQAAPARAGADQGSTSQAVDGRTPAGSAAQPQPAGAQVAAGPAAATQAGQPQAIVGQGEQPQVAVGGQPQVAVGQGGQPHAAGQSAAEPPGHAQPAVQAGAGQQPVPDESLTFLTQLSGGDENYDFAADARAPAV